MTTIKKEILKTERNINADKVSIVLFIMAKRQDIEDYIGPNQKMSLT